MLREHLDKRKETVVTSIVQDETVWFHLVLLPLLGNYLFHWQEEQESELLMLIINSLDFSWTTKNSGRPRHQMWSTCCSGQQTVKISALNLVLIIWQLMFLPPRICMWCDLRYLGSANEISSLLLCSSLITLPWKCDPSSACCAFGKGQIADGQEQYRTTAGS